MTLVQLPDPPSDDENLRQPGEIVKETYGNTTPEKRKLIDLEAEVVHMISNGIDGESIESYYTRFYIMMNEMVRNQLKVDTMQINVQL
nr:hypothetical protein [Tanacetum cinerariifolium]